jgi:hypothetical protein
MGRVDGWVQVPFDSFSYMEKVVTKDKYNVYAIGLRIYIRNICWWCPNLGKARE